MKEIIKITRKTVCVDRPAAVVSFTAPGFNGVKLCLARGWGYCTQSAQTTRISHTAAPAADMSQVVRGQFVRHCVWR